MKTCMCQLLFLTTVYVGLFLENIGFNLVSGEDAHYKVLPMVYILKKR